MILTNILLLLILTTLGAIKYEVTRHRKLAERDFKRKCNIGEL